MVITNEHLSRPGTAGIFMIEVFKTNVKDTDQAQMLLALLYGHFPAAEINFDLEDCDSILRIKAEPFFSLSIIMILANNGFECEVLR